MALQWSKQEQALGLWAFGSVFAELGLVPFHHLSI